ncbi:hypothetical protein [Corynebacterium timonense]|uniref:Uncharacterized protein n=1 Tax=Corynebacterium timonense TaxID=441500 RepID=A0A1H1TTY7_9CORY|nr:hypothetical protein [Corynebacterium timonense]SDS63668.1 hypothetical protein SAMN04488539_2074 [Corynebacterium timonense]
MSTATGRTRAPVVDLALARARREASRRSRFTLVARVSTMKADEEIFRYIGFDEATTLREAQRVVATAFVLDDAPPAPSHFSRSGRTLGDVLRPGSGPLHYSWGLWRFVFELAETYPRDEATPPAVCIAGAGDFGDTPFDIAEVNRRLIGDDRAADVLRSVRPELREVVTRSRMFDYVLLLHALDVRRGGVDKRVRDAAARLPRERTAKGRDAYWSVLLGLACFADEDTTDSIISSTFAALGWGHCPASQVRSLCAGSLVRLAGLGVYGPAESAPVDRLDIFRELLRG